MLVKLKDRTQQMKSQKNTLITPHEKPGIIRENPTAVISEKNRTPGYNEEQETRKTNLCPKVAISHLYICICSSPSRSSAPSAPPGIRPSLSSFSRRLISAMLFASRIILSTRLRSASVSFTRMALSVEAFAAAVETSKVLDFMPLIFEARAEGSSCVPNSSFALVRSASFTFW